MEEEFCQKPCNFFQQKTLNLLYDLSWAEVACYNLAVFPNRASSAVFMILMSLAHWWIWSNPGLGCLIIDFFFFFRLFAHIRSSQVAMFLIKELKSFFQWVSASFNFISMCKSNSWYLVYFYSFASTALRPLDITLSSIQNNLQALMLIGSGQTKRYAVIALKKL